MTAENETMCVRRYLGWRNDWGDGFGLGRSDGKIVGWSCLGMGDSVWNSCEKVERGLDIV